MYEPADVIDVDELVWIFRTNAEPTATSPTQSTSYISHSSILPRTTVSATQASGIPPTAHTDATLPMQSQNLHLPPPTQTVAVAVIHPSPASFADTPRSTTTPVPASFSVVELLPLVPTRVVEIPQTTPALTAETVVPQPAHCHPPLAPVSHTLPPPAHSHYTPMTRTRMHTYTGLPTGMDVHSYSNVQLLTTATTTTSSVSQPRTYYNLGESIAEQEL